MSDSDAPQMRQMLAEVYQTQSRRVFATLVRLLGDFDLAEEALHDAFASAAEQWPRSGVPANPRAWLVSAGRFKAIDTIRRRARFDASLHEICRTRSVHWPARFSQRRCRGDRGRPAAADLHLLPPGPGFGHAGRARRCARSAD